MSRADAHTRMMYELEHLQQELQSDWIDYSLPDDWDGLDCYYPSQRPTTRVTIRLDADMVRWFRKQIGHGYGQRINLILRVYWTALLGGAIKAYPHDDNTPRVISAARDTIRKREAAEAQRRAGKPPA